MKNLSIDRADLDLVLQIARGGSLAAAARELDLEPPAVTKRLAALESRLGLRLFHRTTRRLALTEAGHVFCRHALPLLDGMAALEADLQERAAEPRGLIRIACSFGFGRRWLAPLLADFQERHPKVEVQLRLVEQLPDLVAAGMDAAVWLWKPQGASMVSRKLATNRRVLVASPRYLERHGIPLRPEDLRSHRCLPVREHDDAPNVWRLEPVTRRVGLQPVSVRVDGALSSNSGEVVRDWALAGRGIMLRSLWDVHEPLREGALVHVLPNYAMLDADVHWVAPAHMRGAALPLRLRLLQEHLAQALASPPWSDLLAA